MQGPAAKRPRKPKVDAPPPESIAKAGVRKIQRTSERSSVDTADPDLIRLYLREVGIHPLLTAAEEVDIAQAIESGQRAIHALERRRTLAPRTVERLERQIEAGRIARRRFIQSNLRLVVSIARRYQGVGLPLLDLIQEGNLGLMRAVEKFDWRRGFKFSTYATWWIRQAITRGIADTARTIRIPVHMVEAVQMVRRIQEELVDTLGREPTAEDIAAKAELSVEKVHHIFRLSLDPISLETPIGEGDGVQLQDFVQDEITEAPQDCALRTTLQDDLRSVLATLSERERRILSLRFGLADGRERTLEEIGKEFNLTRERIRQIEAKALARLRHPSAPASLKEHGES